MKWQTYEITAEMNLKNIIAESREVAQTLNEFADDLERIERKYADPQQSEDLGDYPDTIHNQFDNMTGSMNL